MIGYVVPLSLYPKGYRVDGKSPMPFAAVGNQKHYVSFYLIGLYADMASHTWFVDEFIKRTGKKPDMGKSCLRLNPMQPIPYDLIGELMRRISVEDWKNTVESLLAKRK